MWALGVTKKGLGCELNIRFIGRLAYILALPPGNDRPSWHTWVGIWQWWQKGVQAHYAPNQRELALAKTQVQYARFPSFGMHLTTTSLKKAFEIGDTSGPLNILFASDCWLHDRRVRPHPLNESDVAVRCRILNENNLDKHDYVARSVIADKATSARYFSLPQTRWWLALLSLPLNLAQISKTRT